MTSTYQFESGRLKPLVQSFLNVGCDFTEVPSELKKQMRVFVHDNIPYMWLCDGFHFIEAQFTREAINDFRKHYSTIKFSSLREKLLIITRWHLTMKHADSRKCFTSYQNVTIQLVVEQFRPLHFERPTSKQMNEAKCLFRDGEIQCLVKNLRHHLLQTNVLQNYYLSNFNKFEVPSARDIFEAETDFSYMTVPDKIDEDTLMLDDDEEGTLLKDMIESREGERERALKINKTISEVISNQICLTEIFRTDDEPFDREQLDREIDDFQEIKSFFSSNATPKDSSDVTMVDTTSSANIRPATQFYDIKRLLIQERGEEEYDYLFSRKKKQLQETLDDEHSRHEITLNMEHYYTDKQKSRLEFQRRLQLQQQLKLQKMEEKQKQKKTIRFRLGFTAKEIQEKILRFMTTFNPTQAEESKEEPIIQMREEEEMLHRQRALSQENCRNDQSELIETRTVMSQFHHGNFALSQFIGGQSIYNPDDITESEDNEDPTIFDGRSKARKVLSKVEPTLSLYKRYLDWFSKNETMRRDRYNLMLDSEKLEAELTAARAEKERIELEKQAEIEKELERKLAEQEEQRRQEAEIEKQNKIQKQLLKQKQHEEDRLKRQQEEIKLLEERKAQEEREQQARHAALEQERLKKLREIEELEAERKKTIQMERERQERVQRQYEEDQRIEQEARRAEEQKKKEEEERLKEEKRRKFAEEKERLKKEVEEQNRKQEERRQLRLQQQAEALRMKKEAEEEEERMIRAKKETERLAQLAEEEEKNRMLQEEINKIQIKKKEEQERQRIEDEKRAAFEAAELEKKRMIKQEEEILERQRALKEKEKALKLEEQKKSELSKFQGFEDNFENSSVESDVQVPGQLILEHSEQSHGVQISRDFEEPANETTPDFHNDPSDCEDYNDQSHYQNNLSHESPGTLGPVNQSSQSPQFGDQLLQDLSLEQDNSMNLSHLIQMKANEKNLISNHGRQDCSQNDLEDDDNIRSHRQNVVKLSKRKHRESAEKKKRKRNETDSDVSADDQEDSESSNNDGSEVEESEDGEQDGSDSEDGSDSDESEDDQKEQLVRILAGLLTQTSKKDKKKKNKKGSSKQSNKILTDLIKSLAKSKSGKKSSSSKKHNKQQSSEKKRRKEDDNQIKAFHSSPSPSSNHYDSNFMQQQYIAAASQMKMQNIGSVAEVVQQVQQLPKAAKYPEQYHQHQVGSPVQVNPENISHLVAPKVQNPLLTSPISHDISKKSGPMTSFEKWKSQSDSSSSNTSPSVSQSSPVPISTAQSVHLAHQTTSVFTSNNAENIPSNGQNGYHLSHQMNVGGFQKTPQVLKPEPRISQGFQSLTGVPSSATIQKHQIFQQNQQTSNKEHVQELKDDLDQITYLMGLNKIKKR